MSVGAVRTAAELPIVIAGAGPAGSAAAIGLGRAGEKVLALEARGPVATRARNIWLRPQARDILTDLTHVRPGRDTTIMSIENQLRDVARREGVDIRYGHRVVDVVDHGDRVGILVRDEASGIERTIDARMFIDASGGRVPATSGGALERAAVGDSHVYVTAQYDTPPRFPSLYGAFDRSRNESLFFFPISDGKGFVAYLDLPPGVPLSDEGALLAHYDALAGRLQLGTPVSPPQVFDARQHLSRSAASGRLLKIGDSAGNADPYIGAGVAAALVDATAAVRALTQRGDTVNLTRTAAEHVIEGHRQLGRQAQLMIEARPIALRLFPGAHFDERLAPSDLRQSRVLDAVANFLTSRPVHVG